MKYDYVDTHSHLNLAAFKQDALAVAKEGGGD